MQEREHTDHKATQCTSCWPDQPFEGIRRESWWVLSWNEEWIAFVFWEGSYSLWQRACINPLQICWFILIDTSTQRLGKQCLNMDVLNSPNGYNVLTINIRVIHLAIAHGRFGVSDNSHGQFGARKAFFRCSWKEVINKMSIIYVLLGLNWAPIPQQVPNSEWALIIWDLLNGWVLHVSRM